MRTILPEIQERAARADQIARKRPPAGILSNMLSVSLGNIIGGAGGVGLAYRFAFGAGRA